MSFPTVRRIVGNRFLGGSGALATWVSTWGGVYNEGSGFVLPLSWHSWHILLRTGNTSVSPGSSQTARLDIFNLTCFRSAYLLLVMRSLSFAPLSEALARPGL